MFKLALIFIFISFSNAKLLINSRNRFKGGNEVTEVFNDVDDEIDFKPINSLWVLNISDESYDFQRLYLAGNAEQEIYWNVIAPQIENYEQQKYYNDVVTSNGDEQLKNTEPGVNHNHVPTREIKNKMLMLINKLFMMNFNELDSHLHEVSEKEKRTFKLYFTGIYTSLIMTAGSMKYHYFINPPSPFPEWFYKKHENILTNKDTAYYVDIPVKVQDDFVKKFLNLLEISIGHPS